MAAMRRSFSARLFGASMIALLVATFAISSYRSSVAVGFRNSMVPPGDLVMVADPSTRNDGRPHLGSFGRVSWAEFAENADLLEAIEAGKLSNVPWVRFSVDSADNGSRAERRGFSGQEIRSLESMTATIGVDVRGRILDDRFWQAVSQMPVEYFRCVNCDITYDGKSHFSPRLHTLVVTSCKCSPLDMKRLLQSVATTLEVATLVGCEISTSSFPAPENMGRLRELDIRATKSGDEALMLCERLPSLQLLIASSDRKISWEAFRRFHTARPDVELSPDKTSD